MTDLIPQDLNLGEWQTEEKRLPTLTLDESGHPVVGERVVKQRFAYVPLIPHRICDSNDHRYALVDGGRRQNGSLLVKCRYCPLGRVFIPGIHTLTANGQLSFVPTKTSVRKESD